MDEKNMEPRSNVIEVDIQKEMQKSFLDYSMSVIVSRALPDVRDGLKPVHRRILYSQYEDGLTPDKAYKKCATTVGNVLGRYHPHGDASVYDALVRLAQDFSMHYPLVDGHGNFGSVDGDPPAAYRYTEARMSKISTEMLTDIDKDTVNFISNYDDSRKEPEVLPSRFPNLLVNGSTGIAVGMATNIPPHNLGETIDAVCYLIDNPDAGLEDLMEYIKGPDFPTGAMIMGRAGIRAAYATGRVYRLKCYEIPEGSRTSKGMNIANLLPITAEEKVTSMIRVPEFDEEKYLVMVTRNGIIKRTLLSAYNSARKGGLIAIELDEGDELAWVRVTDGSNELIVATKKGMAIRFHERDVRLVGRTARGVKAITLGEDDCVVGMARLREGGKVLTVSETGYGRLSPISDYRIQYRGGKGLLNYHVDKYGDVAAIKVVDLDDDVILISADGVIIRIQADSIRECARPSKGVRVMRIGEDNKVVTLARAPHEEEDDGEELEGLENTEGGEEEIPDSAGDEEVQTPEE